jgi:hypothetical protein
MIHNKKYIKVGLILGLGSILKVINECLADEITRENILKDIFDKSKYDFPLRLVKIFEFLERRTKINEERKIPIKVRHHFIPKLSL